MYFHTGYIRRCSEAFDLSDLENAYAHKTSLNVHRKHPSWTGADGLHVCKHIEGTMPGGGES